MGFGIRLSKLRFNASKKLTMREFCCSHQGKNPKTKKPSVRVGCGAMLRINRPTDEGSWTVTKFVEDHNHELKETIGVTKNYKSHNQIDEGTRHVIADMVDSGMRSTNMYGLLSGFCGGASMVPFSRRMMDRLAYAIKRDECSEDVELTLDLFKELQSNSSNFFYSVQVDKACRVKNIFWSHAVSRRNFQAFGDVVTFDTTYKTNSYNMPFAPFVGVNNHFQSILFGCALLRDETVESFNWLFSTFRKCMNGKEPQCILTDNCQQMAASIKKVFPKASHRVCKWHILKKVRENCGNIYSTRETFKEDFHKVLTQMLTVDEFEGAWKELISEYKLEDCVYLKQMWDIREKWAFPYFGHLFYAGMTTTQRSESVNYVLKRFVMPASSMNGFVKKYERFFIDRLQMEDYEEFHTKHDKVVMKTRSPLERHASKVYTRGVFNLFVEQLSESLSFKVVATDEESVFKIVRIGGFARNIWRRHHYEVYADLESMTFSCVCKMFEHKGILCCYVLSVLIHDGCAEIPEQYVLKRWRKDARDCVPSFLEGYKDDVDAAASQTYRHLVLHTTSEEVTRLGNKYMKAYKVAMEDLSQLVEKLRKVCLEEEQANLEGAEVQGEGHNQTHDPTIADGDRTSGEGDSTPHVHEVSEGPFEEGVSMEDILPPIKNRPRGKPKTTRWKTGGEAASTKKSGKKVGGSSDSTKQGGNASGKKESDIIRYCGDCGDPGHNKSTCGKPSTYKRKYVYKE
ncbi:protein FAR1-RELATED SEQUENCE 5-like isoform X1 [Triticum dicoccoides]|uniref:protein FAR1-RELATED SEQUENCE 5-like isoform X1 n=1 Tax=Triticum dicoccoides TaxID=85692 RepID=UPI0018905011|nr:protein FAR1-RELATED SEQUENCE 5-like isoform X1 [Triticum dicoccoides]